MAIKPIIKENQEVLEREKNMLEQTGEISVDLSEAVEFEVIPGVYSARITGQERKVSQKGTPYIKWELTVFGAEGALAKVNNSKAWTNTMLAGPGAGLLKSFYKAATGEDFTGTSFNPEALLSKEVSITVVEGKGQDGQPNGYPEVKAVKPLKLPF